LLQHGDKFIVVFGFIEKHLDLHAEVSLDCLKLSLKGVSPCNCSLELLLCLSKLFLLLFNGILKLVDVLPLLVSKLCDLSLRVGDFSCEYRLVVTHHAHASVGHHACLTVSCFQPFDLTLE